MTGRKILSIIILLIAGLVFQGCSVVIQKGRRSDIEKIQLLQRELDNLRNAKSMLEKKFSREIQNKNVSIKMSRKGLVITVLAKILFDSGRAKLKDTSFEVLDKVADVLNNEMSMHNVGIEGYTDNQPIKYSKWKSNWELSAHRALSVLHYLIDKGVSPRRLSVIGYGEYRPVVPNTTPENMQKNRRVEIVILPRLVKTLQAANIPEKKKDLSEEEILK